MIDEGVTGFMVEDIDEAVAAVHKARSLSREAVRERFEQRFTIERVAHDYVRVYQSLAAEPIQLASGGRRGAAPNRGRFGRLLGAGSMDSSRLCGATDAEETGDDGLTATNLSSHAALESSKTEAVPNPFYISATTSILERRPRTLKHGDTFAVFDHYGDVSSRGGSPEGVFHKDTRFLSDLRVLVNGQRPLLLSSTVQDNNALLDCGPHQPRSSQGRQARACARHDPDRSLKVSLRRRVLRAARRAQLWLRTRMPSSSCFISRRTSLISLSFAAIAGSVGGRSKARAGENGVVFLYHGLDGVVRRTTIGFDPRPAEIGKDSARFLVELNPGERASLFMTVACEERTREQSPVRQFFIGLRDARRALVASTARAASVETSNDIFNEVLCRSVADLYMLMTDTPQGAIPYAGIPWFSTPFGRDAIITAIEMMWLDSTVAKGVLRFLAATQAKDIRRESEAEPGKILHEMRSGEMARLGEVPFAFYYGSVDSTPLFVMLAGLYFERTRDLATISELWPNIEAALHWIDAYGDRDGDGFVEYQGGETGLTNQGWKDSADSDIPRRRQRPGRSDRALRGARLCLRRKAPRGEDGRRQRPRQTRRRA